MSSSTDLYYELVTKIGVDGEQKLNQLLLLERAYNQRHWAEGIRRALEPLKPKQVREPGQIKRVLSVVEAMEEEANRYDPPRET